MSEAFIPVRVNGDLNSAKPLMQQYGVTGYPTIMFIAPDGAKVADLRERDPAGYLLEMAQVLHKTSVERIEKEAAASPNDPHPPAMLAFMYAVLEETDKAADYVKKAEQADPKTAASVLVPAYQTLVMYHLPKQEYEKAIPALKGLVQGSPAPREVNRAHYFLAQAYIQTDQSKLAVTELETLLAAKDLNAEEKAAAQKLLETARKTAAMDAAK